MALDEDLLREARHTRDRVIGLQHETDRAQVGYQHAIRRLHASGGSLREVADALGLSYQRVHQIVDVGSGKGALKHARVSGACAFCGFGASEVGLLVAGPGLFICDRCVDLAGEALTGREARPIDQTAMNRVDEPKARCGFCGKRRDRADGMTEAPSRPAVGRFSKGRRGVRICGECIALCNEIVAEELDES